MHTRNLQIADLHACQRLYTNVRSNSDAYLHMKVIVLISRYASLTSILLRRHKLLHSQRWLLVNRRRAFRWRNPILVRRLRNRVIINRGNVMDAWPLPLLSNRALSKEILLGMTSHLGWCSRHHHVTWYTPPITFSEFTQPN